MILSIIVATSANHVIGRDNDLIWHMPADMKYFKEKTSGHCVITGRKNYESIPEKFRPLPNRTNIVVTRQIDYKAPGAQVASSIDEAIAIAKKTGDKEVFIIGGAEIYKQSISFVNRLYITRIHHEFEGDAFFPEVDLEMFKLTESIAHQADEKNKYHYTFETYDRK